MLAVYPGSFDPITNGHLNLIRRGLRLFDEVVVGVAVNVRKQALFSAAERRELIEASVADLEDAHRVRVETFEGLLVEWALVKEAAVVLRGLRGVSDFEFEFQMTHLNRRLGSGLETLFMMTGEEHFYVSSQLVREVASFGGDVRGLVPEVVEERLKRVFGEKK